ncbi:hypothetical protein CWO17_21505 [Vibrio sp. 10N.286.45.A3]|jgi:prevent-host-death family protein|nr:hypothetical protein CWO17_21505 [Vibrio sp. 10N.286.45.A3]TKE80091.1 type II toxin-antitoxin system prevent-host-death family antitoxin [Vibrio sp. F12]TKE89646.1 type II toxin-antitoxin system prevent-host-death family antitoxin [Vibrio sp. F12]TKF01729.1 type II toxin-antitoxin system prevent-host-death family antitoxin [Vibrio sp. F12]
MVRISAQGINLKQVMELASRIRLIARAVQCEIEELEQLTLSCIIHWDLNHFVVLTKVCNGKVDINDPAQGKRQLSTIEFARSFTGITLELHPSSNFKKQDKRETMRISQLWENIHGLKRTLVTLLMLYLYGHYIRLPPITESYKLVKSFDSFIMNEKENVMQSLTANTAKTKFGDLLMKVQREPVQINKNGSPVAVMMSCEEYEQLEALKLMVVKSRFEQAEADALSDNLVDGNDFMNTLDQGKFD